jgi:predicted DNA-binding transcriptional regulator AlpA
MNENILIDSDEVAGMLRLGKRSFYNFLKTEEAEAFPKAIKFGPRLSRWRKREVEEWLSGDHKANLRDAG